MVNERSILEKLVAVRQYGRYAKARHKTVLFFTGLWIKGQATPEQEKISLDFSAIAFFWGRDPLFSSSVAEIRNPHLGKLKGWLQLTR